MKKNCIIIEDNPAFVKIMEKYIERIGYLRIVGCYPDSINSAISIFRNEPDLIFLDIGISGLNGLEMLETLEDKPKTIVISNHNSDCLEYTDVEVDGFLQKPIQYDDFKEIVDEVMGVTVS